MTGVNLFGSTTGQQTAARGGIFGSTAQQKPAGGLFSATTTSESQPATGGLFGSTTPLPMGMTDGGLCGSTTQTAKTTGAGTTTQRATTIGGDFLDPQPNR